MNTESYMCQQSFNKDVACHSSINSPGSLSLSYGPLSFQWIDDSSRISQAGDIQQRITQ